MISVDAQTNKQTDTENVQQP